MTEVEEGKRELEDCNSIQQFTAFVNIFSFPSK